jgi:hypothetical protein
VAASVAVEAGHRIAAAQLQRPPEHVALAHRPKYLANRPARG